MMIILMKRSQSKSEKKEQHKHIKRKRTKILKPLTKMIIVNNQFLKKLRPIYEVIDEDYIKTSSIFPDAFITKCKQCPNVPQTISNDEKNNIKLIAMEQGLYTQVIKFWRKDLKFDAEDKNKNVSKLKFKVNPEDHDYGLILIQILIL